MKLRHKFNSIVTTIDSIKFSSKKEATRYNQLKLLKKSGEVVLFLRQTPFHLDGNTKYLCDFLVFWSDGRVTIEDVKGCKTAMYILKKKQVEARYNILITEI